ncbi:MAG TPA: thioredoxin domain-containing protein [Syntrophales bacterium]|nr:thioredoxin domain-containing protein [Syntrophales bacterium]
MASRKSLNESTLLRTFSIPVVIFCLLVFIGSVAPAADAEQEAVPSYGQGPREVLIFSDYFCPPCRALEPKLEPVLDALYKQGNVKIRFVDTPMHKETPLFAKFYLYAAKATPDYRSAMRARQVLFALAGKENVFWMDERIEEAFRKEKVAFTPFDFRTAQPELNRLIRDNRVDSTPTCVIKYSDSETRKYVGEMEILKGLAALRPAAKKAGK